MMITLYIYDKESGLFLYEDIGSTESVINDLLDTQDFTLTPIPDEFEQWYWVDGKWVTKEITEEAN